MRERPILFSTAMVRAILDGRKTQTRRVMKPQPQLGKCSAIGHEGTPWWAWIKNPGSNRAESANYWSDGTLPVLDADCPYGGDGDRLWVKETYRLCEEANMVKARDTDAGYRVWYEADAPHQPGFGKLRPSIFMPRWASRITLDVTSVRVERLQDISDEDAIAEGVDPSPGIRADDDLAVHTVLSTFPALRLAPVARYVLLWDSINGGRPGVTNWNANPWVWVVEFKRVTP